MKKTFRANGKLLLTGEYFVLDGALALALPTKLGQSLEIMDNEMLSDLQMTSLDKLEKPWFTGSYALPDLSELMASSEKIGSRFGQILQAARSLNPEFLNTLDGKVAMTRLEFPRNWGLGTSSTLIYMIAQWAEVDPFDLLKKTFGGSGYDIACAGADGPINYQLREDGTPFFRESKFAPSFSHQLYFVFLDKKQDSREGIARYRALGQMDESLIGKIHGLSYGMGTANTLDMFNEYLVEHEEIVAKTLKLERAKSIYFKDFWGEIKSLGAWGGDFVLATSDRTEAATRAYFLKKGFSVFLTYDELILQRN